MDDSLTGISAFNIFLNSSITHQFTEGNFIKFYYMGFMASALLGELHFNASYSYTWVFLIGMLWLFGLGNQNA